MPEVDMIQSRSDLPAPKTLIRKKTRTNNVAENKMVDEEEINTTITTTTTTTT